MVAIIIFVVIINIIIVIDSWKIFHDYEAL